MRHTNFTVSVVIPSYNHSAYVGEAIESVQAQQSVDIELIVVDDGSQDGSQKVIEKKLVNYTRGPCELLIQENRGAHAAINKGLAVARGDYLQILNSDDRLNPRRTKLLLKALQDGRDFAFSDVRVIDAHGQPAASGHPMSVWYRAALRTFLAEHTVGFGLLSINAVVTTSNFLFRRKLLERIGEFTSERLCHDWRFLLRTLLFTEPIRVAQPLIDYRFHGENTAPRVMAYGRSEGEIALREYLTLACREPPPNRMAPSPYWWPGFFQAFVSSRRSWFANEYIALFLPKLGDFFTDGK